MQLGWIDFSKEQRNKVLSVIHLLSEPSAVDELGIGAIRDGFADIFFPGTSTIQTRARYFLLIPTLFSEIEQRKGLNPDSMLGALHERELDFIEILKRNSEPGAFGIIGEDAGRALKRKPSEIYWNGLRTFGIFKGVRMSMAEYCRLYCTLKDRKAGAALAGNSRITGDENDADDAAAAMTGLSGGFWQVPAPEDGWAENTSIDLTESEARFLKSRILKSVPDSILAVVLANGRRDFLEYDGFEDMAMMLPVLPDTLAADFLLAKGFMNFIYGAYIRFNCILSGGEDEYCRSEWEQWCQDMSIHASFDLKGMIVRLQQRGVHLDSRLRGFLARLQGDYRSEDVEQLDAHVIEREIQLKGKARSKLLNAATTDYRGWIGISRLNYRLPSAQRILADIFAGAGDDNA